MGKRNFRAFRSSKLHRQGCRPSLISAVCFGIFLILQPAIGQAHDTDTGRAHAASDQSPFAGKYIIHQSENFRVRDGGRPEPGYFDSLAIELFEKSGLTFEIVEQMPWKRQMELADHESGHVIYPTTRSEAREDKFKWVGPVSRTVWNLFGFEDRGWSGMSFETILREARIGVMLGSAREAYLRQRGAERLVMVPREELLLPMLRADRLDLVAIGGNILRHYVDAVREEGGDMPDINGMVPYRSCYLYVAISGNVPDTDVAHLQTVLDGFKNDGFFVENRGRHGLSTNPKSAFLSAMLNLDNNGVSCVDLDGVDP